MKKFWIKLMAIALGAVSVFAFAGCGKDGKTTVGVQSGTTGAQYVTGNADMKFDGFDNLSCKEYNTGALAVKAMTDGLIDYVVIDNDVAKSLAASNTGAKVIDIPLSTEQYGFGVDKAQPELLTSINGILEAMKADGRLEAIFQKYESVTSEGTGGGDDIVGFESATYNANNAAGQLVVATNAAFPPYEYKKGNKFVGIDMEIMQIIAQELNLELVINDMDFDAVVTSVGKNNVDIAASGLTINETRKQSVNFSIPYYEGAYQVLMVKADEHEFDECTTAADVEAILKNK